MRRLALLPAFLLALPLAGCPDGAASQAARIVSLNLRFQEGQAPPRVGDRRPLVVSYGGPEGGHLMGAVLLDPPSGLTQWHAEPADAVTFDGNGSAATFTKPGKVKIWASAHCDGKPVPSNALEVEVVSGSWPRPSATMTRQDFELSSKCPRTRWAAAKRLADAVRDDFASTRVSRSGSSITRSTSAPSRSR